MNKRTKEKELSRYSEILKRSDLNEIQKLSIVEVNFLLKLKKIWIPAYRYLSKIERVLLIISKKNSEALKRLTLKAENKYKIIQPKLINPLIQSAKDKKEKNDILKELLK